LKVVAVAVVAQAVMGMAWSLSPDRPRAGLAVLAAATGSMVWSAVAVFYTAGALVFGGGHVVLPLLQSGVVPPGWISNEVFLAGYGAAQAVPGPLFTFAACLGAAMPVPPRGWVGGFALLIAIFPPAFLLAASTPRWWACWPPRCTTLALAAFGLLVFGRVSPVIVVAGAAVAGWALVA
jgi:chromate transporter